MGTNYYLVKRTNTKACPTCGNKKETPREIVRRIGKSSAGWNFMVKVDPDKGIYSLDDILPDFFNPALQIQDEYGRLVTPVQMCNIIMGRQDGEHRLQRVDPKDCFASGEGTWDYFTGEFS